MKIGSIVDDPFAVPTSALILFCPEDDDKAGLFTSLDERLGGACRALYARREFTGKLNTVKVINTLGKIPAERVILAGLGKRQGMDVERIRQAAGSAAQAMKSCRAADCAVARPPVDIPFAGSMQAALEGILLGGYLFTTYRTTPDDSAPLTQISLLAADEFSRNELTALCGETIAVCDATRLARDLVSHPGNVATPAFLADQASAMSRRFGIGTKVLGRDEIEREGMNGLLAVAKGSQEEPRFIVLDYGGAVKNARPIVLVGKGITFDSGGVSLKPREGMERMKDDMSGAAAVIGALQAAAALRLPLNIIGLLPCAENMPDGRAYKPGDVIATMAGKTVEITNTDAEGRMVLCDALHYARRYRPRAIIDLATLTGACMVALGAAASGMMGNDDGLKRALAAAGRVTGERVWELPLWEEYGEVMKSDIADMKNSGGPHAGAITAGWFLKQFVGTTKWAHLDIAGTAWEEKGRHYLPKGATGVGVRLLVEYLRRVS